VASALRLAKRRRNPREQAFAVGVAALRASYPVTMPIVFAGVIVAAL